MKYVIGIDGGTQSTKVTIFDLEGNIVCKARQELRPCVAEKPGYVEHPDDDLWDSLVAASQKLMSEFEGDKKDILGVGLCTIRCCRAFLKRDGTLAAPIMDWMDVRAYKPYVFPDEAEYAATTTGYMTFRLTGQKKDTAANNIHRQWPIDNVKWNWSNDEDRFEKWNLTREKLFDLVLPGDVLGHITKEASEMTGLPEGLPVVASANDKGVEALGSGLVGVDIGLMSLGTYIPGMVCGKSYMGETKSFYTNFSSVPGSYLYECWGIRRGMWTISWFKDLLGKEVKLKAIDLSVSPEELLDMEAEKIPAGSEGLLTLPEWLMPADFAYKKGIIMGFDGRHGRAHIFRSIMEGIAMTLKNNFGAMLGELEANMPEKLIVSGGGSNSGTFMQIFSDVFGVPAVRNVVNEAAGLGAAICAAVATGGHKGYSEAVAAMVKRRDEFMPSAANHKLYTELNRAAFSRISDVNDRIFYNINNVLC